MTEQFEGGGISGWVLVLGAGGPVEKHTVWLLHGQLAVHTTCFQLSEKRTHSVCVCGCAHACLSGFITIAIL